MTPKGYRRLAIATLLLACASTIEAKGPTVRLTVSGAGLTRQIEITDPALLGMSNVYEGAFLGAPVDPAPDVRTPSYTVSFEVARPRGGGVRTMYAVRVARDAHSGALWLYLPARGEAGYRLNVGTILRDGQDGYWHEPNAAWSGALAQYLP
jgi:hypothetical protein